MAHCILLKRHLDNYELEACMLLEAYKKNAQFIARCAEKSKGTLSKSRVQGGESGDFIFFWVVASYLDNRLPAKVQISRLDDFVDRLESTKLIVDII